MWKSLILLILGPAIMLGCSPGAEAKFQTGPIVTIAADEVVDDDLYLAGGNVDVQGRVDGDVTASGGQITLGGEVTGDAVIAGGQIKIEGPVGDDLRVAGGDIAILSEVADDVIAAGGSVDLGPQATVGGDFITGAGGSLVRGTVAGDLIAGAGEVVISGTVRGNADLQAEKVTLEPTALIQGDLSYVSPKEAIIRDGAQVLGSTTWEVPRMSIVGIDVENNAFNRALAAVVGQVQWFLGTLIVGLLLLLVAPSSFRAARETLESSPWATLAMGIGVLVVVPIVIVILGILAIIIGGIAGAPVALVPLAAYIALLVLATPVVAVFIGRFLLRRLSPSEPYDWRSLIVGVAILALIGLVPILSTAVGVLTIIFGFGAWLLLGWRGYTQARRKQQS